MAALSIDSSYFKGAYLLSGFGKKTQQGDKKSLSLKNRNFNVKFRHSSVAIFENFPLLVVFCVAEICQPGLKKSAVENGRVHIDNKNIQGVDYSHLALIKYATKLLILFVVEH